VLTKFLLSSSMGLLEIVESVYENNVTKKVQITNSVQVIHESVREYLLIHGLQKLDDDLTLNASAKCHGRLATWCSNYIEIAVASRLLGRSEQSRAMRQCPLLNYVVLYALNHAEQAAQDGYRYPTHTGTSFETWRLIADIRSSRSVFYVPVTTVHPKNLATLRSSVDGIGREPLCTTMLHLLVLQRLPCLVDIELEQNAKRDAKGRQDYLDAVCLRADGYAFKYSRSGCTALEMAIAMRNIGMASALLREGAGPNVRCGRHGYPLEVALRLMVYMDDEVGNEQGPNVMGDVIDSSPIMLKFVHLLLEGGAASPVDGPHEITSSLLRAIRTSNWDTVKLQLRKIPRGEILDWKLLYVDYTDPYGLHDSGDSDASSISDEETTTRSDGSAETIRRPSLHEADMNVSDLGPEIIDPPWDQIAEPTILGRIYHALFGPSTRRFFRVEH
jgi:hypothetical protein